MSSRMYPFADVNKLNPTFVNNTGGWVPALSKVLAQQRDSLSLDLADPEFTHAGAGRCGKAFICIRPTHSLHLGSLTELRQENSIELPGCRHGSLQSANHLLGPLRITLGPNCWRRPWRWLWCNRRPPEGLVHIELQVFVCLHQRLVSAI